MQGKLPDNNIRKLRANVKQEVVFHVNNNFYWKLLGSA